MAAEESIFPHGDMESGDGNTLSDAELIAATRAGDAGSFAVLYTRHVDAAHACARRLVRSRSEADDLVAEGFAKVLGALRKGKGPDLAFRPYLLTAVRNALYDRTRRDSRVEFTDEPPEPVNAVLLAADYEREDRAMVAQAYAALPERWQLVLWHADVEGRQPAEIAPLLGISANSVAALAYRAREGLRQAYLNAHVNRGVNETCKGTTEKLSAYVRDGLSARDRRAVQEHLDGCTSCTALLVELEEANRSLKIVLIPVLAGVSAAAYLGGLPGGGVTRLVRRNPGPTVAGAVAAAAVVVFAAVALRSPGGGDAAAALTPPPVGSGRPTTTTTTTTTAVPTTAPRTTAPTSTIAPYVPPTFDTAVPPITNIPYNPNATTATTVRRSTTTTRPTTTTRAPTTTTTTTTTAPAGQPGGAATTTTTTTSTTVPDTQAPPAPPALQSSVSGLGPVYSGQNAYFSVRVSNAADDGGPNGRKFAVGPAEGVVVTFNAPAGSVFSGASNPDWQCEQIGATVRCLLPRLDPGVDSEAVISLDVPADRASADFTISPIVMVNGNRIDTPSIQRAVANGAPIADFTVDRGGALAVAGNSVSSCVPGAANEDQCVMPRTPVNVLGGGYLNSSSAILDLGARPVHRAYLVWQGKGDPDAPVTMVAPDGTTRPVNKSLSNGAVGNSYAAMADVTDVVRAAGGGTYTVANVQTGSAQHDYGGWAIVAVVDDGSGALRGLSLALPLASVDGQSVSVPVGGLSPTASARNVAVALLAGEGDRTGPLLPSLTTGEHLTLNGTTLSTSLHPDDNVFRSSVVGLAGDPNTFGTDLDVFPASVPGDADALTLQATKAGDGVTISAVALLYDL